MAGKTPAAMPTSHAHPMSKCCNGSLPIGGNDLEQIGAHESRAGWKSARILARAPEPKYFEHVAKAPYETLRKTRCLRRA